jgi:hypothetical protein
MFLVYVMLAITLAVVARLIFVENDNVKLKARNRLLCRENHKLRLKQEADENSSKR